MTKAVIQLETLSCPSCLQKIENTLKRLEGVEMNSTKVLFNSSKVRVDFDSNITPIETIEKAIEKMGYPIVKSKVKTI